MKGGEQKACTETGSHWRCYSERHNDHLLLTERLCTFPFGLLKSSVTQKGCNKQKVLSRTASIKKGEAIGWGEGVGFFLQLQVQLMEVSGQGEIQATAAATSEPRRQRGTCTRHRDSRSCSQILNPLRHDRNSSCTNIFDMWLWNSRQNTLLLTVELLHL